MWKKEVIEEVIELEGCQHDIIEVRIWCL